MLGTLVSDARAPKLHVNFNSLGELQQTEVSMATAKAPSYSIKLGRRRLALSNLATVPIQRLNSEPCCSGIV